jgi:hypothetical protein
MPMITLSLKARLKRLAKQLGCCPTHGTPLYCALCCYSWTGTEAEWQELEPLANRISSYLDQIQPSGRVCRTCQGDLWCRSCYESAARQSSVPDDLFTPEELSHYTQLLQHMRLKPQELMNDGQSSSPN